MRTSSMTSAETMTKENTPLAIRLLSDRDLSANKPSAPIKMDGSHAVLPSSPDDVSFLRLPDVKLLTGLSRSTLYALVRSKNFPKPVQLGPRTVAWVRSEVKEWAVERISTSRSAGSPQSGRRIPQRALGEAKTSSRKFA